MIHPTYSGWHNSLPQIVYEYSFPDYLKNLIIELGIEKCVEFTGKLSREEMLPKLSYSNVFVLPSNSETFGVVYIEAMALGLPVIATKCGGPEDFLILLMVY